MGEGSVWIGMKTGDFVEGYVYEFKMFYGYEVCGEINVEAIWEFNGKEVSEEVKQLGCEWRDHNCARLSEDKTGDMRIRTEACKGSMYSAYICEY